MSGVEKDSLKSTEGATKVRPAPSYRVSWSTVQDLYIHSSDVHGLTASFQTSIIKKLHVSGFLTADIHLYALHLYVEYVHQRMSGHQWYSI